MIAVLLLVGCVRSVPPAAAGAGLPDLEAVCPTTPPAGYRLERGEASNADAASAIAAAREFATRTLLDRLCEGVSEERCDEVARAIKPWKDGYHDTRSGFACASVAVERDVLDGVTTTRDQLESDVTALAAAIAVAAARTPISIPAPMWAEGCPAGPQGDKLFAWVTNALSAHALTLAAPEAGDAAKVQMTLTPSTSVVTVAAQLRRPDGTGNALPGFAVPNDLLPEGPRGCAPSKTEPAGRNATDRAAVVAWLTEVVTSCEKRVGDGQPGLDTWWVRFKVEAGRAKGINASPGLDSPAPQQTQFAVASCVREAILGETWASEATTVHKSTVVSELPSEARKPQPTTEPGVVLVLRNPSREWLDVRIDGEVVAEMRNVDKMTVTIAPGTHQLEIVPFMGGDPLWAGRLATADRGEIAVGIDVAANTVTAYDGIGLERLDE